MIKGWDEADAEWRRKIKVEDKKTHSQVKDSPDPNGKQIDNFLKYGCISYNDTKLVFL